MNEMDDQRKSSALPHSYFQTVRSSNDGDLLRKAVWDSWNSKWVKNVLISDICCLSISFITGHIKYTLNFEIFVPSTELKIVQINNKNVFLGCTRTLTFAVARTPASWEVIGFIWQLSAHFSERFCSLKIVLTKTSPYCFLRFHQVSLMPLSIYC